MVTTDLAYEVVECGGAENRSGWLPERASWVAWEVRRYPGGLVLRYERDCSRWASSYYAGPWMLASEREAAILRRELDECRKRVALYVHTLDNPGTEPNPPLEGAERPCVHASTWLEYLRREASKARRVTK